jgi:hypothetical protein
MRDEPRHEIGAKEARGIFLEQQRIRLAENRGADLPPSHLRRP